MTYPTTISDEQIEEERIFRNFDFGDVSIETAIALVDGVAQELASYERPAAGGGVPLTQDEQARYLPLVLEMLHKCNLRDDARNARRIQAGIMDGKATDMVKEPVQEFGL